MSTAHSKAVIASEHLGIDAATVERTAERAARVLSEAKRQQASAAEVHISRGMGLSVGVRLGEVETLEFHNNCDLTVVVYQGQRKGVATTTDDSDAAIAAAVTAAVAIAHEIEADPFAGLADHALLASCSPDLDLYHPWALSPSEAIDEARRCEAAGRGDSRIINSEGANLSSGVGLTWYANSAGFNAGYRGSSHQRSCVLIAQDGSGMQRDYWYDSHCVAERLASAERVGQEAARRVLARLGGKRPTTGTWPVLFVPDMAVSLLGHLIGAISGGNLYRKNSFLCEALGEKLFPDWVEIGERPQLPRMPGSLAFDGDGLATRTQTFITAGELHGYALGLYSARQLGMEPTGNGSGVHNLYISSTGQNFTELLRAMNKGVLVTELMGSAVNPVTGDYSRGAAGFWVEDGEIAYPIEEFTLAGNLRDMFQSLRASGTDVDRRRRIHTGSLLIDALRVAGN